MGFGTALGAADLHVHSVWSDGLATVPQILAHAEAETDLDILAIADHDQVRGALEAVEWCAGRPGGRLQAVVASEISAAWGRHVLALFFAPPYPVVPFPRFKSLAETASRVHDAGGVIVLPHPFSALVPSVGERTLTRLLRQRKARPELRVVQGLEVCSGVVGGRRMEPRLRRVNAGRWRLAPVGSSDAHHLAQIGTARTRFAGRTPEALREALAAGATEARWGPEGTVTLRQHARQGWVSLVLKPARELRAAVSPRPASRFEAPPPAPRPAPSAPAAYEADASAAGTPSEAGAPPAEAPSKGAAETEEMVAPPRTTSPS